MNVSCGLGTPSGPASVASIRPARNFIMRASGSHDNILAVKPCSSINDAYYGEKLLLTTAMKSAVETSTVEKRLNCTGFSPRPAAGTESYTAMIVSLIND